MGGRTFIDTNVFLYLFDRRHAGKADAARDALKALSSEEVVVSTQVLEEFYWNATRKLSPPLTPTEAATRVTEFAEYTVVVPDVPMLLVAISRCESDRIAFWDALIVEAALSAGCERLLTEDLQNGREFGTLRVENPFLS